MLPKFIFTPFSHRLSGSDGPPNCRDRFTPFLLSAAFIFAAFFRLRDLAGSGFCVKDERRSLLPLFTDEAWRTPFFSMLYKIPGALFGNNQETMLFTTALLGIVVIAAVYVLGKRLFDARTGAWAALFTAISPTLILQSRSGYPFNVQTLFLIIAFYFLVVFAQNKERPLFTALAIGVISALTFTTYAPSYMALIPIGLIFAALSFQSTRSVQKTAGYCLLSLVVFLAILILFEIISRRFGTSYLDVLLEYKIRAAYHADRLPSFERHSVFFWHLAYFRHMDALWFPLLITLSCGAFFLQRKAKRQQLLLLIAFTILCYSIFAASFFLGVTLPGQRRIVFLIPFVALIAARGIHADFLFSRPVIAGFIGLSLLINSGAFFANYRHRIFKIEPIHEWLRSHGIENNSVISDVELSGRDDSSRTNWLPYRWHYGDRKEKRLRWQKLQTMTVRKKLRYILITNRFYSFFNLHSECLDTLKPLAVWRGPVHTWTIASQNDRPALSLYSLEAFFAARDRCWEDSV